jgi:hypothetical protein
VCGDVLPRTHVIVRHEIHKVLVDWIRVQKVTTGRQQ